MWERLVYAGKVFWQIGVWREKYPWLCHGFTTRGVKKTDILNRYSLSPSHFLTGEQIHGKNVEIVSSLSPNPVPATDGMITNERGLMLVVYVADCVPVMIVHPSKVLAVVHAGWRGTAQRIVEQALGQMSKNLGLDVSQCEAALGPAIGPCCYKVGWDVARQFPHSTLARKDESFHLDLKKANVQQLLSAGLKMKNIHVSAQCTCCSTEFFSYRREGTVAERMYAYLMIEKGG